MDAPVVLERDHEAVQLGWRAVAGALSYELQMSCLSADSGDTDPEWKSLSSSIQSTNIRKKNLSEGSCVMNCVKLYCG
jgi:hypothetical protein